MKLDTSSYYPKSPLDDDPEMNSPLDSASGIPEEVETVVVTEETEETEEIVEVAKDDGYEGYHPDTPPNETENIIDKASHLLSLVLVPLLMPVYGVMLAFGLSILSFTSFGVRFAFTAIVFGFNVVIPAIVIWVLKRAGVVTDVGLNKRDERFIPYMVSIICLAGTALFMHFKGAPMWFVMFLYGGATAGLLELIVNKWWKISVHAAGIAGIVAMLIHIMMGEYHAPETETWLLISIGLAGLLGSARVWLGRHTLWQVLAGYAVGFCSVFFLMMVQ